MIGSAVMFMYSKKWDFDFRDTVIATFLWPVVLPLGIFIRLTELGKK